MLLRSHKTHKKIVIIVFSLIVHFTSMIHNALILANILSSLQFTLLCQQLL